MAMLVRFSRTAVVLTTIGCSGSGPARESGTLESEPEVVVEPEPFLCTYDVEGTLDDEGVCNIDPARPINVDYCGPLVAWTVAEACAGTIESLSKICLAPDGDVVVSIHESWSTDTPGYKTRWFDEEQRLIAVEEVWYGISSSHGTCSGQPRSGFHAGVDTEQFDCDDLTRDAICQ